MGVLNNLGVSGGNFFGGSAISSLSTWIMIILSVFVVAVIFGGLYFLYAWNKSKKVKYRYQIEIYVETNGKLTRDRIDWAQEIFVPNSNISLFVTKNSKIFLPRPTRQGGRNLFNFSIRDNGEWVNFNLSHLPEHDTLAKADFDHRDTRYAYVHLKDIIQRNYKDKSVKWWKQYYHVIAFVIITIVFIVGFLFIVSRIAVILKELAPLVEAIVNAKGACSGVMTA